jgi:hypothetical protein
MNLMPVSVFFRRNSKTASRVGDIKNELDSKSCMEHFLG